MSNARKDFGSADSDFAALFNEFMPSKKRGDGWLSVGDRVKGRVAVITKDNVFVSVGSLKSEAVIAASELRDESGALTVKEGDVLEAAIVHMREGEIVLSTGAIKAQAGRDSLENARNSGMPVDGTVSKVNKGGLEVELGGAMRGFCPISQIDVRHVEDASSFVGQRLSFLVTDVRGRDIVLSRRKLLEQEASNAARKTRATLEVGKTVRGTVRAIHDFGVFIEFGGLDGFIPPSELSHQRGVKPSEVLSIGQEITAVVTRIEPGDPHSDKRGRQSERIGLSLRALEVDPWTLAVDNGDVAPGRRLEGKVVRIQPFGAFVELFPGVDGLVHISKLSDRRIARPEEAVRLGDKVFVEVERIDEIDRRIALRRIDEDEFKNGPKPKGVPARVGDVLMCTVDRVERFGVFVKWDSGKGLIPAQETGLPRGADLRKQFPDGSVVQAMLVEPDEQGRTRLSIAAVGAAEERRNVDEYIAAQKEQTLRGSLADQLERLRSKFGS